MTKETTTTTFDDSDDDVNKDTIIYYNADADKDDNYDADDDAYNTTTASPNFVILRQDKTNTFVPLRQDKTTTMDLNFDNTNKNTNTMNPTVVPLRHNKTTNPTFMPLITARKYEQEHDDPGRCAFTAQRDNQPDLFAITAKQYDHDEPELCAFMARQDQDTAKNFL